MSGLREAIDSVCYERLGGRIGGPDATIEGHWPALIVSMIVVFACFFAIGRVVHTGGSAGGEAPTTHLAASGSAAIPAALAGASPAQGATPIAIATAAARRLRAQHRRRPTRTARALNASAPGRSFTSESPAETTSTALSESSGESTSAPATSPPTVEQRPSSPAPARSESHSPAGSSSGGGSFDSSE